MVDEHAHLELADRHVSESRARIADQEALVRGLVADGHDSSEAEAILETFRETLIAFLDHRALIVEAIDKQSTEARRGDPAGIPRIGAGLARVERRGRHRLQINGG